jgi:hypothetical protein
MSSSKPPIGRTSRSEVRTISSLSESNREPTVRRQSSFSGNSRRLSESETGRTTPTTGVRAVNRVMEIFNKDISSSPVGRHGLIVGNTQSELESMRENVNERLAIARKKLSNMKKKPKTALSNINKQREIIKGYEYKLREHNNAIQKVLGRKRGRRESHSVKKPQLKRTKSTEEPPTINTQPRKNVPRPTPVKKNVNFLSQLKRVTGEINRSKETVVETQAPPKNTPVKPPKTKNQETQTNFLSNIKMGTTVRRRLRYPTGSGIQTPTQTTTSKQTEFKTPTQTTTSKQTEFKTPTQTAPPTTKTTTFIPTTPTTKTTKINKPPSIKEQYYKAKLEGTIKASKNRNERRKREGTPRARRSLEPIFNKMAKSPKTPPEITKSNLQQFLAPFKQPISIQFAPSIKATGGTGGNATVIQIKNKKNDDKKKKPIKKFNILADPTSAYRKSVVASKRKEIVTKLRTPTVGQRKKHVIELIDKELRLMKVPKDIERKMISLYSKVLSEKQIKQLFGGRSTGDVKKILKKQVDYFKKKKR